MIAPTEAQCDSPYVVTRKSVPKVDIFSCNIKDWKLLNVREKDQIDCETYLKLLYTSECTGLKDLVGKNWGLRRGGL